jgi:hypothetical protein
MTLRINLDEVAERIDLSGDSRVVRLDRLAKETVYGREECARNIFLVDAAGKVIWQVATEFDEDGNPFTSILYEEGKLKAYRWDGYLYEIDITSGRALPTSFLK